MRGYAGWLRDNDMEPWPYIIAAYACTIGGTVILTIWRFVRMRSNEARAAALREDNQS